MEGQIIEAEKSIRVYKTFRGTNKNSFAPYQDNSWGKLHSYKLLRPLSLAFSLDSSICRPGIHSARLESDARLSERAYPDSKHTTWLCIIPAGTSYYEADKQESRDKFSSYCTGNVFRSEYLILVREVKRKKRKKRK